MVGVLQVGAGLAEGLAVLKKHPSVKTISPHRMVTRSLKYVDGNRTRPSTPRQNWLCARIYKLSCVRIYSTVFRVRLLSRPFPWLFPDDTKTAENGGKTTADGGKEPKLSPCDGQSSGAPCWSQTFHSSRPLYRKSLSLVGWLAHDAPVLRPMISEGL